MMARMHLRRDGRLSPRTIAVLGAVFVLALIVLFPLRLALGLAASGNPGLRASSASGTIWSGRIADLQLGALPIGTVDVALRPLPLLLGRGELAMTRLADAGAPPFSGVVSGGTGRFAIRHGNGTLALGGSFGALPVTTLTLRDFTYRMDEGACAEAGGQVTLVLASLSPLMPAPIALTGNARCERGVLLVPLAGSSGAEKLVLRVRPDGTWEGDLLLAGLPPEVSGPLLESGFSGRPGGIGIMLDGKI